MQARPLVPGHGEAVFSLVLPAYNPGPYLERTWREITDFLRTAADPWEVLFVCDGCTDGTPERLAGLSQPRAQPGQGACRPPGPPGGARRLAAVHRCGPGVQPRRRPACGGCAPGR